MTISSTTNRISFAGDGTTVAFATGFKFFANGDLTVIVVTDSTGAESTKVLDTDYTVVGAGLDAGGTVTMTVAPVVGETLVIVRSQAYTQGLDLEENDPFPSESVEEAFDKSVILAQQNRYSIDRSVNLSEGFTGSFDLTLPNDLATANATIVVNGTADGFVIGPTTTDISNAEANATAAAASAAAAAVSEGNAATSETNAGNSATAAQAAQAAAQAALAASAIAWAFDSDTTMADPGTGDFRLDNATVSSVTNIAVSASSSVSGNPDVSDFVATWGDSTNTALRGTIVLRKDGTPDTFAVFSVTGAITDNTIWLQIPVTYVDGNGTWSDTDASHIQFTRTGDKGLDGAGAGDVVGPASATDSAVAQYDGTTGKLLKDGPAIGTSANNLVQLDGAGALPAVDGSQLTGVGGGPSLGTDSIIRTNATTIAEDITIPAGQNGITAGPITIRNKNELLYSDEFNNAVWSTVRASLVLGQAVPPYTTNANADELIEDTSTNTHVVQQTAPVVFSNGELVTASVYAKRASGTRNSRILLDVGSTNVFVTIDLTDGSIRAASSGLEHIDAGAIDEGDGWYRLWVTGRMNQDVAPRAVIYTMNGSSSSYTGDGTSSIYIAGAQVQPGGVLSAHERTTNSASILPWSVTVEGTWTVVGD